MVDRQRKDPDQERTKGYAAGYAKGYQDGRTVGLQPGPLDQTGPMRLLLQLETKLGGTANHLRPHLDRIAQHIRTTRDDSTTWNG